MIKRSITCLSSIALFANALGARICFRKANVLAACLLVASTCPAFSAITFQFGGAGVQAGINITIGSLTNGTPTSSYTDLAVSGTLSGVSNTDSFTFFASGYNSSSLSGNTLTLGSAVDFTRNSANGWGVSSGASTSIDGGTTQDALGFTFNLANLPANTGIRITSLTAVNQSGAANNVQVVVNGKSSTILGGLTGSGLSIDVTNGDLVAFRNMGPSGNNYRLRGITFDTYAIPEPSAAVLGSLGTLLLLRRRRR
jgi:hypothetical protein